MSNYQATMKKILWIGLAAAILMGCGAKSSEFKQTAGEMKEGPGLFTGKEGEFAIYDSKKGGPFWKQSKDNSEEASKETDKEAQTSEDKTPQATQTRVAAGQTSKESDVTPEAAKEFQEFQEWKKTAKGAAEYKEFLEWKEWKSYQEWKKQQGQ